MASKMNSLKKSPIEQLLNKCTRSTALKTILVYDKVPPLLGWLLTGGSESSIWVPDAVKQGGRPLRGRRKDRQGPGEKAGFNFPMVSGRSHWLRAISSASLKR